MNPENYLLGALLLGGDKTDAETILKPSDFADERNGLIYQAILSTEDLVDPITVADKLGDNLAIAGGFQYVSDLTESAASSHNVSAYAELVLEASRKRQLFQTCLRSTEMANGEGDSDELLSKIQAEFASLEPDAKTGDDDAYSLCESFVDYIERVNPQMKGGYYDDYTGGIQNGLHIIAAGTGHGKTFFSLNLASNLINNGYGVGYYSYEMPKMKVMERIIGMRGNILLRNLRDQTCTGDEMESMVKAITKLRDQKLYVHDEVFDLPALCASIRRGFTKGYIDCAFVDYLQLVPSASTSREQEVANVARSLQQVAQSCSKPIFGLSQLSRAHESRSNPRPRRRDLRESGEIEHAAETILFLFDESMYLEDTMRDGFIELYSDKNRNGEDFNNILLKKDLHVGRLTKYNGVIDSELEHKRTKPNLRG
jgi:replicative DNA helicase